jgi:hypothetical protein
MCLSSWAQEEASVPVSAKVNKVESSAEQGQSSGRESSEEEGFPWLEIPMPFQYQNILIPQTALEKMTDLLAAELGQGKKIDDYALIPISLQVELTSKDPYVLRDKKNYRLQYVEGGGQVDLFRFVVGKGEFAIRLSPHLRNDNPFHLLYISDSPYREVEGVKWGNGCGRIYDLSQAAHHFIFDQGMKVTSARRHHLSMMAGTFLFFQLVDERIYLGYIQIADSRFPQFNCRNK